MRRVFILFFIGLTPSFAHAQSAVKRIKSPDSHVREVKQVDDFFDRFNAVRLPNGQKAPDSLKNAKARTAYLEQLVNSEDARWQKGAENEKLKRFLQLVCHPSQPLFLNKFDDQIFCVTSCNVDYFGTQSLADLLFRRKVFNEKHQWVLQGASDPFMEQLEHKIEQRGIVPNAHETNFLSFSNELHGGAPLRSYTDSTFRFDALSAFIFAVDSRLIKFNECERVTLFLTGIKGWVIKLEDFTRETGNSGWLISDLMEVKEEPLTQLLFQHR